MNQSQLYEWIKIESDKDFPKVQGEYIVNRRGAIKQQLYVIPDSTINEMWDGVIEWLCPIQPTQIDWDSIRDRFFNKHTYKILVAPKVTSSPNEIFEWLKKELSSFSPVSTDEKWIPIEDRLPDNSNYVLFFYKNVAGKNRVSHGFYAAKYSVEADFDQWEGFADYNEEKDEYYVPTGWYEGGWELEFTSSIKNVTHWMEKPEPPKTTL